VRAGDTLATIAAATGVSVARLQQLNPGVEPTSLFIGDRVRLR
jgi:LysM repeat protein